MCIICDKPAGVDMPSEEDIKYMFTRNPNGAGFAVQGWFEHIVTDKRTQKEKVVKRFEVHYQKGFMNVDDLIEALGSPERLKDKRVVMHCRITTSGNSDQQTTHPFPLSSNYGDLRKTEGEGAVLFHNGVFQGLGGITDKKSSDTQDFVIGVANRMLSVPNHISKISQTIAKKIAGECRVLILYPNPNHPDFRMGTWHDHNGCHYSNTGWRGTYSHSSTPAATKFNHRDYWDDYDEEYYARMYGYGGPKEDDDYEDEMDKMAELYEKKDTSHDFDAWGCNHGEYAYPEKYCNWIDLRNYNRVQTMRSHAVRTTINKNGVRVYYYRYDDEIAWFIDEKNREMYTEVGWGLKKAKEEEQMTEEEKQTTLWNDNVLFFAGEDELDEFIEASRKVIDNEYEFDGKYWLLDTHEMIAYTEVGLTLMFKPGEIGHVRAAILLDGYDSYTEKQKAIRAGAKSVSKEDMKKAFKQLSDGKEHKCVLH